MCAKKAVYIDSLRLATPEQIYEAIGDRGVLGGSVVASGIIIPSPDLILRGGQPVVGGGDGSVFGVFTDVPSLVIFKILNQRFGKPNGWGDPPKVLWRWIFKTPHGLLAVYDWKGSWSIGRVGGIEEMLSTGLLEEAKRLRDDLIQIGSRMRPSRAHALGGVITNPYRIFSDAAGSLLDQVADLKRETEVQLEAYRKARKPRPRARQPRRNPKET